MLESYYSEQPDEFLEQLLIVPDFRLRVPNCIYKMPRLRLRSIEWSIVWSAFQPA